MPSGSTPGRSIEEAVRTVGACLGSIGKELALEVEIAGDPGPVSRGLDPRAADTAPSGPRINAGLKAA